ncbi:hypothetical protein VB735_16870 [Halotia wernerae UHCC 0503]|nr:hypothetical protein [Halotia wernerae UHCC 0503]
MLCQKVNKGEDISQCIQVLEYLKNEAVEQKLQNVVLQGAKQKIAFIFWQKVGLVSLSCLSAFTLCAMAFYCFNSLQADKYQSNSSIDRQIKDLKNKKVLNNLRD